MSLAGNHPYTFFRYVVKISLCSKISVHNENFAIIAKFPLFLKIAPDLHSASEFSLELQKLIQEKLQKSEKQARTKINLKIRENLRRKLIEIQIK